MAWNPWYRLLAPTRGSIVGGRLSGTKLNWNVLTKAAVKRKRVFRARGSPKHIRCPVLTVNKTVYLF